MKRPRSHEIDEQAQRCFQRALPLGWIVRTHDPDYGSDFEVEIVENEEVTGLTFLVQLKGTASLRSIRHDTAVSFALETKHLVYYVDRVRRPVLLVVVDVEEEMAYWVFLQGYALSCLKGKRWRDQATVAIHLPKKNLLERTDDLKVAVEAADKHMAALWPASVADALRAEKERLESLDPRIVVKPSATDQGVHYHLEAKESFKAQFRFIGESSLMRRKLEELFDLGKEVTFERGQVQVMGSPLLERAFAEITKMQHAVETPVTVYVLTVDAGGAELTRLEPIHGNLTGGRREQRFRGSLPESPLLIEVAAWFDEVGGRDRLSGKGWIGLEMRRWAGQRVSKLAHFDQICTFAETIRDGATIMVRCYSRGNQLFSTAMSPGSSDWFTQCLTHLSVLRQARHIVPIVGADPKLPDKLTGEHITDIAQLYSLLTDGIYRTSGQGLSARVTMGGKGVRSLESHARELQVKGRAEFDFLGTKVPVEPVEFTLTHARLGSDLDALRIAADDANLDDIDVHWVGTEHSELVAKALPRCSVGAVRE